MDVILIAPYETPLRDKVLFRENKIKTDYENITENSVNFLFVKFLKDNLGIASLAAFLRKYGYSVQLINSYLNNVSPEELCDTIVKENPQIVGISLLYDLHSYHMCKIVKLLRERGYQGHITLGGPFITLSYEYFLRGIEEIDSVICGEGEYTLLELLKRVKDNRDWKDLDGIAYRINDNVCTNQAGSYERDLSKLPFVARDLYEELVGMLKAKKMNTKVASIYTSRGCRGRCTYCSAPALGKLVSERWRCRSVESVVSEIKYLVNEFNVEYINIIDENFFGYGEAGKKRLYELANAIIEADLHLKFWVEVRVDIDFDEKLFFLLKKAGLQDVLLGLESGSQTALNRWKKGTTVEQNKYAIEFIRKANFVLEPSFIMVDPFTDLKEFKETVKFIDEMKIWDTAYPLNLFNQLIVFPGTEIEQQLFKEGIIKKIDVSTIDVVRDDDNEILKFCQKVSSRDYEIIDPVMRIIWDILTSYTNKIAFVTEEFVQTYINHCKKMYSQTKEKHFKDLRYEFVIKIGKWRRNIGKLVNDMLNESILCAEEDFITMDELKKRLQLRLYDVIERYSNQQLEQNIEDFMNSFICKAEFSRYENNDFSTFFAE